jgi:hypothetical protein
MNVPPDIFITYPHWWQFWLWFRKPVRIPFKNRLTGAPVFASEPRIYEYSPKPWGVGISPYELYEAGEKLRKWIMETEEKQIAEHLNKFSPESLRRLKGVIEAVLEAKENELKVHCVFCLDGQKKIYQGIAGAGESEQIACPSCGIKYE